jgi:restriction system protein
MPVPTYQQLMLPLLRLVAQGEASRQGAVRRLAEEFCLTPEEASHRLPGGQTMMYNAPVGQKTELSKAGLVHQPRRGMFAITDRGRQLLADPPPTITRTFLLQRYPEFRTYIEAQRPEAAVETIPGTPAVGAAANVEATPDEQIGTAAKTLTTALEADLLERVRTVEPTKFEQIVVDLLIAMGFGGGDPDMGQRLGRSGDGGIDGVIQEDALGLDAVYLQAKRYQDGSTIGLRHCRRSLVASLATDRLKASSSRRRASPLQRRSMFAPYSTGWCSSMARSWRGSWCDMVWA